MIIDADCHISSHKFDDLAITAEELVVQMDRAGVDRALVWLKPPYDKNIEPENRAIYVAARQYSDRLIPFGWTNPRLGKQRASRIVKQCFEEYGFAGIKFNGAQDGYVIDDPAVMALIEEAVGYGKPLAFHIGGDFPENTHPYRLGQIAQRFPQTQFIMIHMGGAAFPPLDRSAIETAQRHENITLIGSAIHERAVLGAIQALGPQRVCFGSDMPFFFMHARLAMYQALLRDFSEEDKASVLGGNIARLVA